MTSRVAQSDDSPEIKLTHYPASSHLDTPKRAVLFLMRSYRTREVSPMTRKALGAIVVAAGVLATGVVADAQGPIRLGASLSLTGTYAKLGKNQHEGYQLCQKDLNAKGGLLGRKVEFVVYDDQSLPPTGVRLYEKLITED